jgi:hypothetical protein
MDAFAVEEDWLHYLVRASARCSHQQIEGAQSEGAGLDMDKVVSRSRPAPSGFPLQGFDLQDEEMGAG